MKPSEFRGRFFTVKPAVFILAFLLSSGLTAVAQAGDLLVPLRAFWSNKLPDSTQLKNEYTNLSTKPFDREELALNLLIPSNWRDEKVTVKTEQLENDSQNWILLTTQLAPEEEKSEAAIQVAYIRLDLEMGLRDYMDQHVEANNYTVLLRRHGIYNEREVEEVLVLINDQIARITFSRHGDRIFSVICSSPESEYQRYAMSFAAAAISFDLKDKTARMFPTAMTTFSSEKTPAFAFRYPDFWEMEEAQGQPDGQNGVEIGMMAPDEKGQMITYGYIYVQGYDKSTGKTPAGILAEVRKTLEAKPMTFEEKILTADLAPEADAPLLKLERFRVTVNGTPAEAATLVIPRGSDLLAMSLVIPPREANYLAWMHCWRIFEIAANDLAGKELPIAQVRRLTVPSRTQLAVLVSDTMETFSQAVKKRNFSDFYNNTSRLFQVQSTADRLRSAFSGFDDQPEIPLIGRHDPVLTKESHLDPDGLLNVEGYFPTKPQATTFQLTYLYEKPQWKLLGINIAMKDKP